MYKFLRNFVRKYIIQNITYDIPSMYVAHGNINSLSYVVNQILLIVFSTRCQMHRALTTSQKNSFMEKRIAFFRQIFFFKTYRYKAKVRVVPILQIQAARCNRMAKSYRFY